MNLEEKKLMGQRIRACRIEQKLSQESLAELLDMKRTNVANYESGRVIPPGNVLIKLADIFSVQIDYLLGRTPNKTYNESGLDDDIRSIARAAKKMSSKEREKMMNIVKLSFEEAFEDEGEDDDEDDDL